PGQRRDALRVQGEAERLALAERRTAVGAPLRAAPEGRQVADAHRAPARPAGQACRHSDRAVDARGAHRIQARRPGPYVPLEPEDEPEELAALALLRALRRRNQPPL